MADQEEHENAGGGASASGAVGNIGNDASEPASKEADGKTPPAKKKRGRPPGSKNKTGTKNSVAEDPVATETETELPTGDEKSPSGQTPPVPRMEEHPAILQWIDRDKLVRCEPFSNLLPVDSGTSESIKADMEARGFDPAHPVHVWKRGDALILVDGHTRDKAADELRIDRVPAFVHHFEDEAKALDFAIRCQVDRRNLTGGQLYLLGVAYDEKVKPGSTQLRQEDGTFAPKASTDATGKSAAQTAEKLKTTATNVERIRYLHKHADAATKDKLAKNKLTLSGACEAVRKQLKEGPAKPAVTASTKTKDNVLLAFDPTPASDVAFATWEPVLRSLPVLSADLEDEASKNTEVEYVLAKELLDLPTSAKGLGTLANRRVLVSPSIDLFAEEVPTEIVRTVLKTAAQADAFCFLFTTTNPGRLAEFQWEENTFVGATIKERKGVAPAEDALQELEGVSKWLVIEQLTMELTFQHLDQLDWLVVREGAGLRGTGVDPHAMKSLLRQAWAAGCPVLFEQGVVYRPTDPPKAAQIVVKAGEDAAHE